MVTKAHSDLFRKLVHQADLQRPGFSEAVGLDDSHDLDLSSVPEALRDLYGVALGTPHQISEQKLMDIVPAFRFIRFNEISGVATTFHSTYPELAHLVPFLADYMGSHFLISADTGEVYFQPVDESLSLVSRDLAAFLNTCVQCYIDGIYFLDEDGYLDYDSDQEARLGSKLNPGCDFWE